FAAASAQLPVVRSHTGTAQPAEVEILYKPKPVYTDEARRLKIEGEVLLDVIFTASGEVKVLRVSKGLGHGLDEAAIQAAAHIRFKPAERDGSKADSTATARITFSLAY
ncbi:MAG TPA: energy transducer TonB, partial [Terracidiphilus sp.]